MMFKKIFYLFIFLCITSYFSIDSLQAQDKTEVTQQKTDKEKKSDGDTVGTVTESKDKVDNEKEDILDDNDNSSDDEDVKIEQKEEKNIDAQSEEKKSKLDKKAQRKAERQARREKRQKIRQAKIDKISLEAKTDRKARKAKTIKEKKAKRAKIRAERRARKNKNEQFVENTNKQEDSVEKIENKQELDPIPNPQKSSILVEVTPSLKLRKLYPSSFIFKSPDACFGNSNCIVTLKDGVISESSKSVLESSNMFFVKIDISQKPLDISSSADSILSSFDKFVISEGPSIRHRIKGVIFDAFSDFEQSQWKGHEEELNIYFSTLAKDIKKKNKDLLVGGIGFNSVFEGLGEYKNSSAEIKSFLDYISRLKIPCDFIYINTGNLMPYNYFLEPAFLKSKILPEYSDLKLKIYVSVSDFISKSSDKDMGITLAFQNAICALKSEADFVELPDSVNGEIAKSTFGRFFANEVNYCELNDTKGLDRLSFVAQSAKTDSEFVIIFAVSNPSKWINENSDSDEIFVKKFEEEYRVLVHKFTDGFFSPEYTRFRMSLTDCDWSGKSVKMERFLIKADGSCSIVEEENMEGRSEYFFNKSISSPSVMVIRFSLSEKKLEENKSEDEVEKKDE